MIARLILQKIRQLTIHADAIGGLTLGADPIVASVAVVSELEGAPMRAFIVRKEPKAHGMQRFIEGWDGLPGSRVVIVDDVCTTGDSILKACDKAEEAGYVHCGNVLCCRSRRRRDRSYLQSLSVLSLVYCQGTS